jgi:hypothetical protein
VPTWVETGAKTVAGGTLTHGGSGGAAVMRVHWRVLDNRLPAIVAGLPREAEELVKDTADIIAEGVMDRVDHLGGGRVYWYPHTRPVPHRASNPGDPPANWTGALLDSLANIRRGRTRREVSVQGPHVAALEFGGSPVGILPRPYFGPSVDDAIPQFERRVATLFARVIR